jgi:hypothetical protein
MKMMLRETVHADEGIHSFMLTGPPLFVASRNPDRIEFWYEHNPDWIPERYQFVALCTGEQIPPGATHVGTTLIGALVWHLYRLVN